MIVIYVLLLAVGVVCFGADALNKNTSRRVDLVSLGLVFVFLVPLLQHLNKL